MTNFAYSGVPSREALAKIFGLEELRIGHHYLRSYPKHGERLGSLWVKYYWLLEVRPSFNDPFVVCAVSTDGELFDYNITPSWTKVTFATSKISEVLEVSGDPLPDVLNSCKLLPAGKNLTLDGVGYQLEFANSQLQGRLKFANPKEESLINIVSTVLRTAQEVAINSGNQDLCQIWESWHRYEPH